MSNAGQQHAEGAKGEGGGRVRAAGEIPTSYRPRCSSSASSRESILDLRAVSSSSDALVTLMSFASAAVHAVWALPSSRVKRAMVAALSCGIQPGDDAAAHSTVAVLHPHHGAEHTIGEREHEQANLRR